MSIYKPPKLKRASEFLTNKKVKTSTPEEYYEVTSQKFGLYDMDTAYEGSERAKKEKEEEKAREKRVSMPSLKKIKEESWNYNPDTEYRSQEEASKDNRQAHIDAGYLEEEKKGLKLPFFNSTSQEGKPKATMSGNRSKPNENQRASLQVGGDTIYNQNRKATTDTGNSLMTDGNVKGMAKSEGVNGKFVDTKMDINFLKDVGTGLKNVPRNALSGFSQAVGDVASVLEKVTGVKAPQSATDRESIEKEYGKMSDEVYEETKTYLEKLNGQKLSETIRQTTTSIASEINEDTSKVERMIQGASQAIPGSYMSAMFGGLLGGVAKSYGAAPKLVKAIALSPLFTKATAGGLDEADEIGLKGTAKVGYALTMGGIETLSEGLFDNGVEASLMGLGDLSGLGLKQGIKSMFKQGIEEGSEELVSSIASNLVRSGVTGEFDFEAMLDDAIVSFGAGAISGLVGSVGKLRNGTEYKIVGETSQGVVIETSDGKIETVQAETVFRHKFDTVKRAYLAEIVARPVTESDSMQEEVNVAPTMPLEAPTTSVEQSNVETDNSTPKEAEVATEDVKGVETDKPVINELDKGVEDYYTQEPDLAFQSDEGADLAEVNLEKAKKSIRKVLAKNSTFEVKRDGVIRFTVHESNKGNGKYQLTSYDNKGEPLSDSQLTAKELVEEVIYYQIRPSEMIAPELETAQPTTDGTYTYQYRLRGFSPGAQPSGVISNNEADGKYGSITYDRPLTAKELSDYELDVVRESKPKPTTPKINDNKSITPKNMETRQTAEAKLDNMIKNKLIDSTKNRSVAEALNKQIVDLGGKDRADDFKKVVAPKVKKAEKVVVKSDTLQTNNMTSSDEVSDVLYPGEGDRVFKTRQSKKTLMESDKISQTMKDRVIEDDPALYEERKQRGVITETKMDIQKIGYDNVYKEILAKVDEGDALNSDYDRAMLASMMEENQKLRVKHNDNGFYQDQFDKIYKIYAETGTENARGLAMQGQLATTPVGKAMQAKRTIEKHRTEEQGKLVDDIDKVVEGLFIEDNLVDVDTVIDTLDDSFNLTDGFLEDLRKELNEGKIPKTRIKEKLEIEKGVPTVTQTEFDELTKLLEEVDALDPKSETYEKDKKTKLGKARRMIDDKQITFWQKVSSIQTMAMLMNVKTTLRNEVGNFLGFTTGQLDDVFSYMFDMPLSKLTGQQGTLKPAINPKNYHWWKNAKKSLALYNDQTASGTDNKYQKKRVFAPGSNLGKLEGILAVMLSDTRHKQSRIDMMEEQIKATEQYAKDNSLKFDAEGFRSEFNYYADYNTFNFDSSIAKWLDTIVKESNEKLTPFTGNRDFGVGTVLAKFAKTPMNIIQYQLDHLGADIFRVGLEVGRSTKNYGLKNAIVKNQTRISRALGKTATGMTYIGLGMLLSNAGAFIDEEEDKNTKALLEANGINGGYFNFSALRRSIFGGDSAYQPGDSTISITWMLPVAPFLLLGSRLAKAKDENEVDGIIANLQVGVESLGASMKDFAELPFARTLGILTNSYDTGMDKFNKVVAGSATGFIPSPVKQLAQGLDPTSKLYSKNTFTAIGEQIKTNLPMLRNTVPSRFDITGEAIKFTDNETVAGDILEMFVNPSYSATIGKDTKIPNILKAIKEGKVHTPPKVANNYFSYNNTRYDMTPIEHQQYQKDYFEVYYKNFLKRDGEGQPIDAHTLATEQAKINYMKNNKIRYFKTDSGRLKLPTVNK